MWRDVSGTVGGGGSNGRWTVVSSDITIMVKRERVTQKEGGVEKMAVECCCWVLQW